jgi:hypothetical protein
LEILFANNTRALDIAPFLYGDSARLGIKWRKCDYKKLPYRQGKSIYFENISAWVSILNNTSASLRRVPDHDYIFWIDRKIFDGLPFKPDKLQINISLVDSTGTKHRKLTDSIFIN